MVVAVVAVSTLLTVGVADAASNRNITRFLKGVTGDIFQLDGTLVVKALKVKGVTHLNGSVKNNTKNQPLTVNDDAKIKGDLTVEGILRASTVQDLISAGASTSSARAAGGQDESTWSGTTYDVKENTKV